MSRKNHAVALPDLTGKRAVVTGASDGIGLVIATHLAGAGAQVVLPVRSRSKGEAAARRITEVCPAADLVLEDLDLASLDSVASLGERLRSEGAPIHVLVNNAGVMTPPERQTTVDGHELQLGTNHLGHFALAAHLLPLLRAGNARVTSQLSIAARRGSMNWDDPDWQRSYDGMRAYRQSKIALGLFALELARRSDEGGWGITSTLSHPGVAPTSLLSARPELGRGDDTRGVRVIRWLSARGLLVGTPETAAEPALVAATTADGRADVLHGPTGPGAAGGPPGEQRLWRSLRDDDARRRAWSLSEELTGIPFG